MWFGCSVTTRHLNLPVVTSICQFISLQLVWLSAFEHQMDMLVEFCSAQFHDNPQTTLSSFDQIWYLIFVEGRKKTSVFSEDNRGLCEPWRSLRYCYSHWMTIEWLSLLCLPESHLWDQTEESYSSSQRLGQQAHRGIRPESSEEEKHKQGQTAGAERQKGETWSVV